MLKHLYLLFTVYLTITCANGEQQFNETHLEVVQVVHRMFCGMYSLCTNPGTTDGFTDSRHSSTTVGPNGLPLTEGELVDDQSMSPTMRRLNDLPDPLPDLLKEACCQPCSCNVSTCGDFGTCCPDILEHIPSVETIHRPSRTSCQKMSLQAIGFNDAFWLYTRCHGDYIVDKNTTAADIKLKCENRDHYSSVNLRLPVVDLSTKRVYGNRFCAICGFADESDLIPMTPILSCYDGSNFIESVSLDTIVESVLKTNSCDLEFHWPYDQARFLPTDCLQVETECNVTGLWKVYDPLIEAACHTYTAAYNRTYNNVFCMICNGITSDNMCLNDNSIGGNIGTTSFSVVMDFKRVSSHDEKQHTETSPCSETQFYDHFKDVCRDLSCTFPRILKDKQCINIGKSVRHVAYKLQLKFQPNHRYEGNMLSSMILSMHEYTEQLLVSWGCRFEVSGHKLYYKLDLDPVNQTNVKGISNSSNSSNDGTTLSSSDEHESERRSSNSVGDFADHILSMTPIPTTEATEGPVGPDTDSSITGIPQVSTIEYVLWQVEWRIGHYDLQSELSVDEILGIDGKTITLNDTLTEYGMDVSLYITDLQADDLGRPLDPEGNTSLAEYPMYTFEPNIYALYDEETYHQLPLKQTLACPLFKLDTDDYRVTERHDGLFVEYLNTTFERTTYERKDVNGEGRVYLLCYDAHLFVKNGTTRIDQSTDADVTIQGVLSTVCSCVSILCSILTVVTYSVFRELRTQPGINNMLLCLCLICAQAFFTFATHPDEGLSEWLCPLLGVVTHFFWLMVVFAMNVCCYHMFKVFMILHSAGHTKTASRFAKTMKYLAYCVCSSVLFVSINIIVEVVDTDGQKIGYGGDICYISRPEMVGYVFALPLGVVVLSNLHWFNGIKF